MKFLHLADLHLGKSVYGLSLIDSGDQPYWVDQFLLMTDRVRPDAVVIAGDVYDRSNPSGDAMDLFDHMLTELNKRGIPVLFVAGNHDSGQRLSFAGDLLSKNGIYIAGTLTKQLMKVTLPDREGSGDVNFYLMPYVFPALVSEKLEDDSLRDYDAAVRALLKEQNINPAERNVLVAHQNVTAFGKEAPRGGSESMVGGVGMIDYTAFDAFDYVALGHIHSSYPIGRDQVRYAGSPLCYHFDECRQPVKGPVLVTIGEKTGSYARVTCEVLEIKPLHPMREIRGTYDEIKQTEQQDTSRGEYVRIVLTDRRVTPDFSDYLRDLFASRDSKVLEFVSDFNEFSSGSEKKHSVNDIAAMSLSQLFADFYKERKNGSETGEREQQILTFAEAMTEQRSSEISKDGRSRTMEADVERFLNFVKKEAGRSEEK